MLTLSQTTRKYARSRRLFCLSFLTLATLHLAILTHPLSQNSLLTLSHDPPKDATISRDPPSVLIHPLFRTTLYLEPPSVLYLELRLYLKVLSLSLYIENTHCIESTLLS